MVRIATELKMQAEARGARLTRIWVTITPPFAEELKLHNIGGINASAFIQPWPSHRDHFHAEFYVPNPD
jgi:hypothetical protein